MTGSNLDVVRRLFERYEQVGIDGVLEVMDEDVLIEIPPELSTEPDDYHGHDGVRRYFSGFTGMIDDVRYELIELTPVGDAVIAHIRLSGRGASSGLEVDLEAFVLHDLANGRIVRMRSYAEPAQAQAAAAGR